jgi:hypothetical protein
MAGLRQAESEIREVRADTDSGHAAFDANDARNLLWRPDDRKRSEREEAPGS